MTAGPAGPLIKKPVRKYTACKHGERTVDELTRRREVVRKGETDHLRWSQKDTFDAKWASRAAFAAAMCADSKAVCDIGCGMQTLRSFLSDDVTYLPADLTKWTPDTLFCDLNKQHLP